MGKYSRTNPPIPWRTSHDLTNFEKSAMYRDHLSLDMFPQNGFLDDFLAHTYGYETTNSFAIWTAIAGISSIAQRDMYLRFGDGLYPNFYIILVAPPGICHKSTALARFDKAESIMFKTITNQALKLKKKTTPIRGKATPEQLFLAMENKPIQIDGFDDEETNANLIIRVSELSTFLSKAQYNATLIDKLTDFYDCKDRDTDSTVARGTRELKNIFSTMFSATTPDALVSSIPPEAFGGGFISRCIIVQENTANRIISRPYYPSNCPLSDEIAERLLWIMVNKQGEYTLSREADDFYEEWYAKEVTSLREKALIGETDHRDNRKTLHVLKLALTLAIQRYDLDHLIHKEDLEYAIKLLEHANEGSRELIEQVSLEGTPNSSLLKIRNVLKRAGDEGIFRAEIMRNYNIKKAELDEIIVNLHERGLVLEGRKINEKTGRREKYYYYNKEG